MLSRILLLVLLCSAIPSVLAGQASVSLEGAWIRALPPTQPVTAAYVSIRNGGSEAIVLSGASIEGVGRVEIHTTREVDGLMRMEQLSTLEIKPGQTRSLAPGGAHFMLFDLDAMPRDGESRELCLLFDGDERLCTQAQVRKSAEQGQHQHHQHH